MSIVVINQTRTCYEFYSLIDKKFNYSVNITVIICFTHLNSSIYHAMPSDLSQVPVILASTNVIDRPIVQNVLSIDRFDFAINTAPYQLPQLQLKILVVFHLNILR